VARDVFGNVATSGFELFQYELTKVQGDYRTQGHLLGTSVAGPTAGTYFVEYIPSVDGSYALSITHGAYPVILRSSPPMVVVLPGLAVELKSNAFGAGLYLALVHVPQSFHVQLRDAFGKLCSACCA
jgi:hypothetical protein